MEPDAATTGDRRFHPHHLDQTMQAETFLSSAPRLRRNKNQALQELTRDK
jgi:hypothetical protein